MQLKDNRRAVAVLDRKSDGLAIVVVCAGLQIPVVARLIGFSIAERMASGPADFARRAARAELDLGVVPIAFRNDSLRREYDYKCRESVYLLYAEGRPMPS